MKTLIKCSSSTHTWYEFSEAEPCRSPLEAMATGLIQISHTREIMRRKGISLATNQRRKIYVRIEQ
jgi:hypothetical protein